MTPVPQLIARIQRGDRRAFLELIERYQRLVEHVVFRMVRDGQDREEICQDVFVKVYRKLHTFRAEAKLSTWIARIAYTTALNHLSRKRVPLYEDEAPPPDEEMADDAIEHLPGEAASPYERTADAEAYVFIHTELHALPVLERTVLTLYHLEEMSLQEISMIVERPVGTVKSDLFRARKKLKNRLLTKYTREELQR